MNTLSSSLKFYPQKNIESFSLESLAASPDSLLSEIEAWTGNNLWLNKYICQVIADYNYFIPSGMEAVLVERIIHKQVIENWQNPKIASHFNQIQQYFYLQSESYSRAVLLTYSNIWQQGKVLFNNSQETEQLIELGLVTQQENYCQVSNRLYQLIFNYDWVQQQLFAIKLMNATPSQRFPTKNSNKSFSFRLNTLASLDNNHFSQIVALISLSGLGLMVSLIFFSIFETQFMPDIEIEQSRFEKQFLDKD